MKRKEEEKKRVIVEKDRIRKQAALTRDLCLMKRKIRKVLNIGAEQKMREMQLN